MHKHTIEVAFIPVTWLQAQQEFPVYGYLTERIGSVERYGGIAVHIKQEMP
jgi:hypothetical protein